VLVSDLFLTSHAYLKDAAIRIRACCLRRLNNSRPVKAALQYTLKQAQLQARDIQLVEAASSAQSGAQDAVGEILGSQPQDMVRSTTGGGQGGTGLIALCQLGKLACIHKTHHATYADESISLAPPRLDPRTLRPSTTELPPMHLNTRHRSKRSGPLSLGW
jgi:hypothetical protein